MRFLALIIVACLTGLTSMGASSSGQASGSTAKLSRVPPALPQTLHLGLTDRPEGATDLSLVMPGGYRYHYLAGGLNTGGGWQHWRADGAFVTDYIKDSHAHGMTPFFSYYMLRQSAPGKDMEEHAGVRTNLRNKGVMTLFYQDLKYFFEVAGRAKEPVVLQVEPDMWGYIQKDILSSNSAQGFDAIVTSSGLLELQGLPDNAMGIAQAIKRLRDQYAKNVILAYPVSIWGTNVDIADANPSADEVSSLSYRAAEFYYSLKTNFDLVTIEFNDRDSGYKVAVDGIDPNLAWWDKQDFDNHLRFVQDFVQFTKKRVILWQIPLGNTVMRTMDNSRGHYQDNRVQTLLDDPKYKRMRAYLNAGVIAFLFGGGADGTTCACDQMKDGVTNPLNDRNKLISTSADDDGGYFKRNAKTYYRHPPFPLPMSISDIGNPRKISSLTTTSRKLLRRGQKGKAVFTTKMVAATRKRVNIGVNVHDSRGRVVMSRNMKNQLFRAHKAKRYRYIFRPTKRHTQGVYTVSVTVHEYKRRGNGKRLHHARRATQFRVR